MNGASPSAMSGTAETGRRTTLPAAAANDAVPCSPSPAILELAKAAYQERRHRNDYFGDRRFAEPAWDILLDLFVRMAERRETTVSSSCIAASVPSTNGLRQINSLVREGFARRYPNPTDSRSALLELTPAAVAMMTAYFQRIRDARLANRQPDSQPNQDQPQPSARSGYHHCDRQPPGSLTGPVATGIQRS